MADQPETPSSSHDEPGADDETTETEAPTSVQNVPVAPPLDDPAADERRAQLRGRAILAGAATALTLGGGLTGFVIGHATDGDDMRPANFSRQGPGGGQFGNGQQPPPNFDRGGNGGGPTSGNGSGSSSSGDRT